MKTFITLFIVALTFFTTHAAAENLHLKAENAYAFATTPVQKNGAAFMKLHNQTPTDITITSASSNIADKVELHAHEMDDKGNMSMREIDMITIPANGSVTLEPMGLHIMFMGLKAPLEKDTTFAITLAQDNGARHSVDVRVIAPGTQP